MVSSDSDGVVIFWDVRNVKELFRINCGPTSANRVALDPSGQTVFIASDDGSIRVCSTENGALLSHFNVSNNPIQCLAVDQTGSLIVAGDSLGKVKIFG